MTKKAQISLEVLYSVGIMIIIFIILTGISFERKNTLNRLDSYLERKNECYRIANIIDGVHANGDNTIATFTIINPVDIQTNGVIIVQDEGVQKGYIDPERSIEAHCTYHGNVVQPVTNEKGIATVTNTDGDITITII